MVNFIEKLVPKVLKRKLYNYFLDKIRTNNRLIFKQIPRNNLNIDHLVNAKLLPDRDTLLTLLPKGGIVAELGVDEGNFSSKILKINQPEKLFLIDIWNTERFGENKKALVLEKFGQQIKKGQVEIELGLSTQAVTKFEDSFFDWIFIDTDHSFETTMEELNLWSKKVKHSGLIICHDFIVGNWNGMIRYGVREAVYEFCLKNNWEIIYVTMEIDFHPSVVISRLSNSKM